METAQFSHLLAHTHQQFNPSDYQALKTLAAKYPYSAVLHALIAKQAAFFESSDNAKALLAIAATHAPDRQALRHFIEYRPVQRTKSKPIPLVTNADDAPEADQVLVVTADQLHTAPQTESSVDENLPAWMKDIDEDPIWLNEADEVQHADNHHAMLSGDPAESKLEDNFDADHEASFGQDVEDTTHWPGLDDDLEQHPTSAENQQATFTGHQYSVSDHEALTEEDHAVIGEYLLAEVDGKQTAPNEEIMLGPAEDGQVEASSFTTIDPSEAVSDIETEIDDTDDLVADEALIPDFEGADFADDIEHSLAAGVSEDDVFNLGQPQQTDSFFDEIPEGPVADITEDDAALHNSDDIIAELLAELDKYQELKKHSPLDLGHAGENGPDAHTLFENEMAEASESPISEAELEHIFHPELDIVSEVEEESVTDSMTIDSLAVGEEDDSAGFMVNASGVLVRDSGSQEAETWPMPQEVEHQASEQHEVVDNNLPQAEISIYEQLLAEQTSDVQELQADATLMFEPIVDEIAPATSPVNDAIDQFDDEDNQDAIISRFLDTNPKITIIKPTDDVPVYDLSAHNQPLGEEDVTENLAQILVKQGKLDKAIEIYCKLILKNPEKTSYFASRINALAGAIGEK